jgi:hypothetical protein
VYKARFEHYAMKTAAFSVTRCLVFVVLHTVSCGSDADPGTDTNIHWDKKCTSDAQCGAGTSCQWGACTIGCETHADCSGLGATFVCVVAPSSARICVPPGTEFDGDDSGGDAPSGDDSTDDAPARDDASGGYASHADDAGNDGDSATGIWAARPAWSTFDFDRRGRALALASDGSVYITGGQDRGGPSDAQSRFHNFWLARFSSTGEPEWEQIDPLEEGGNWGGLSIALTPGGVINTITVRGGDDAAQLLRHDSSGMPLGEVSLETGIKWLATSPSGELIGAGLDLVEDRDRLAFTDLWVGGISGEGISWQKTLRGVDGSFSFAWDLALTADTVFVAGAKGASGESDSTRAWLGAGPLGTAEFDWELELPGKERCSTIALAPDGGVVVAGRGGVGFVHRYDADGTRAWERDLHARPAALVSTVSGYAVGYYFDGNEVEPIGAQIDFFDWDGTLVWRFEDSSCDTVNDLVVDGGDLVALLECNSSLGLFRIPIDQEGAALGGVDVGVAALRACANRDDCERGHGCQHGTCAQNCTATNQCPPQHRCVLEQDEQGECPLLGPGEPGTPGVCLPRCSTHADCSTFAPGLSCLNDSCVLDVPTCESRCLRLIDGCVDGCSEIRARGVAAEQACVASQDELLGCYPEGRISTSEDGCVKSPAGTIYSAGGLQGATLIRDFGFSKCTNADLDLLRNAPSCAEMP